MFLQYRKRPKYKGPLLPGTPAFELLKDVTDGDKLVKEMLGKEVPEFFVGIISKERSENVQMIHAMFTGSFDFFMHLLKISVMGC